MESSETLPDELSFLEDQLALSPKAAALRCPLSGTLMADPVKYSDGHTYDRSSIARLQRLAKLTGSPLSDVPTSSPKTNDPDSSSHTPPPKKSDAEAPNPVLTDFLKVRIRRYS